MKELKIKKLIFNFFFFYNKIYLIFCFDDGKLFIFFFIRALNGFFFLIFNKKKCQRINSRLLDYLKIYSKWTKLNTITLSILVVRRVILWNSSIMCQDQFPIFLLYFFIMNFELPNSAMGWAYNLTHRVNGLPMDLDNNGLGH